MSPHSNRSNRSSKKAIADDDSYCRFWRSEVERLRYKHGLIRLASAKNLATTPSPPVRELAVLDQNLSKNPSSLASIVTNAPPEFKIYTPAVMPLTPTPSAAETEPMSDTSFKMTVMKKGSSTSSLVNCKRPKWWKRRGISSRVSNSSLSLPPSPPRIDRTLTSTSLPKYLSRRGILMDETPPPALLDDASASISSGESATSLNRSLLDDEIDDEDVHAGGAAAKPIVESSIYWLDGAWDKFMQIFDPQHETANAIKESKLSSSATTAAGEAAATSEPASPSETISPEQNLSPTRSKTSIPDEQHYQESPRGVACFPLYNLLPKGVGDDGKEPYIDAACDWWPILQPGHQDNGRELAGAGNNQDSARNNDETNPPDWFLRAFLCWMAHEGQKKRLPYAANKAKHETADGVVDDDPISDQLSAMLDQLDRKLLFLDNGEERGGKNAQGVIKLKPIAGEQFDLVEHDISDQLSVFLDHLDRRLFRYDDGEFNGCIPLASKPYIPKKINKARNDTGDDKPDQLQRRVRFAEDQKVNNTKYKAREHSLVQGGFYTPITEFMNLFSAYINRCDDQATEAAVDTSVYPLPVKKDLDPMIPLEIQTSPAQNLYEDDDELTLEEYCPLNDAGSTTTSVVMTITPLQSQVDAPPFLRRPPMSKERQEAELELARAMWKHYSRGTEAQVFPKSLKHNSIWSRKHDAGSTDSSSSSTLQNQPWWRRCQCITLDE